MIISTEVYTCVQTGLQVTVHITKHIKSFKLVGHDESKTVVTRISFETSCGQPCTAVKEDHSELLVYTGGNRLIRIVK